MVQYILVTEWREQPGTLLPLLCGAWRMWIRQLFSPTVKSAGNSKNARYGSTLREWTGVRQVLRPVLSFSRLLSSLWKVLLRGERIGTPQHPYQDRHCIKGRQWRARGLVRAFKPICLTTRSAGSLVVTHVIVLGVLKAGTTCGWMAHFSIRT